MARLASLVVDLQVQSAELRKGLDEANRKLDDFGKQAERTGNILAGAFTFDALKDGAAWLVDFVRSGADAADAMGEMASAVGVPVEELSKLAYAAELSGSSAEAVGKALSKTADLMAKSQVRTSEQAAIFKVLGISATDAHGKLRATGDVFADIAQRFAETDDGAAKTALAVKLFGDEGVKLIPMLNNGKAGLAAFGDEAERTGAVVTEKGAAAAGEFNDALTRLEKASQSLALRVAQDLAPSMAALAEELATSATRASGSAGAFDTLTTSLRLLASACVVVGTAFDVVGKAAAGAAAWTAALFDDDAMSSRSGEAAVAAWNDIMASLKAEGRQFRAIWSNDGPGAAMQKDAEKAAPAAKKYSAAIDSAVEAQKKLFEFAKKASEASGNALEAFVNAQLELNRKLQDIERAMQRRRSDLAGEDPTKGFANLDEALEKLERARKAQAKMLAQAAEQERDADREKANAADLSAMGRKKDAVAASGREAASRSSAQESLGKADLLGELGDSAERAIEGFKSKDAAAAALLKQFDDIDRAVALRRAEARPDAPKPTQGFANFNAALDTMATALKEEAARRLDASALEKKGLLAEARQATLAADAQKALAESASAAAESFAKLERARANVPTELGGMLLSGTGPTTSAVMQGAETGSAAGPWGAIIGAGVGLLTQSEAFKNMLEQVESILQKLADSVGKLIEPLMPLLSIFSEMDSVLFLLIDAITPIIEFVARPLFMVFRAFGIATLEIIKFVGEIVNEIAQFFGGEGAGLDLSGIDKALNNLKNSSYDTARAEQKVADKAREMSESLNIPSWWKVELGRFNAADPGAPGSGSSGGGTVVHDNSTTIIHITKEQEDAITADKVIDRIDEKKGRKTLSQYGEEQYIP